MIINNHLAKEGFLTRNLSIMAALSCLTRLTQWDRMERCRTKGIGMIVTRGTPWWMKSPRTTHSEWVLITSNISKYSISKRDKSSNIIKFGRTNNIKHKLSQLTCSMLSISRYKIGLSGYTLFPNPYFLLGLITLGKDYLESPLWKKMRAMKMLSTRLQVSTREEELISGITNLPSSLMTSTLQGPPHKRNISCSWCKKRHSSSI